MFSGHNSKAIGSVEAEAVSIRLSIYNELPSSVRYLCITRKLRFALLVEILCVRVLASSDGSLVNSDSRMSVFHHHAPLRC